MKALKLSRLTDDKRTSVSRAQSCWASIGDEAAVILVAGSRFRS